MPVTQGTRRHRDWPDSTYQHPLRLVRHTDSGPQGEHETSITVPDIAMDLWLRVAAVTTVLLVGVAGVVLINALANWFG